MEMLGYQKFYYEIKRPWPELDSIYMTNIRTKCVEIDVLKLILHTVFHWYVRLNQKNWADQL